jgi:hypothetical protein
MGQVYSVLLAGSEGDSGSSAIPHFGQGPGPIWRTSGHIGQTWGRVSFPADCAAGAVAGLPKLGMTNAGIGGEPSDTSPDVSVIALGGEDKIFSGFASNFWRQPAQQKKYSLPLCCFW